MTSRRGNNPLGTFSVEPYIEGVLVCGIDYVMGGLNSNLLKINRGRPIVVIHLLRKELKAVGHPTLSDLAILEIAFRRATLVSTCWSEKRADQVMSDYIAKHKAERGTYREIGRAHV